MPASITIRPDLPIMSLAPNNQNESAATAGAKINNIAEANTLEDIVKRFPISGKEKIATVVCFQEIWGPLHHGSEQEQIAFKRVGQMIEWYMDWVYKPEMGVIVMVNRAKNGWYLTEEDTVDLTALKKKYPHLVMISLTVLHGIFNATTSPKAQLDACLRLLNGRAAGGYGMPTDKSETWHVQRDAAKAACLFHLDKFIVLVMVRLLRNLGFRCYVDRCDPSCNVGSQPKPKYLKEIQKAHRACSHQKARLCLEVITLNTHIRMRPCTPVALAYDADPGKFWNAIDRPEGLSGRDYANFNNQLAIIGRGAEEDCVDGVSALRRIDGDAAHSIAKYRGEEPTETPRIPLQPLSA
jgi:hypothetical protein